MTTAASISVSCPGGNLDELGKLIAARQQTLKGETTESAVKATTINVLKSLRADTPIVGKNPTVFSARWKVSAEPSPYIPGWAIPPRNGQYKARRVVRTSKNGPAHDRVGPRNTRIINLAGSYRQLGDEKSLIVFKAKAYHMPGKFTTSPFCERYILSYTREEAVAWMMEKIVRPRIQQYRRVFKRLLGIAMHKVSAAQGEAGDGRLDAYADVQSRGSGYSSGSYSVAVNDLLPHSADALKSGGGGVAHAVMKAANATAAIINRAVERTGFGQKWNTPFPEVSAKRRAS